MPHLVTHLGYTLRHHKPSQRGYVFKGKRHYLGHWPRDEERAPIDVQKNFHEKCDEFLGNKKEKQPDVNCDQDITVLRLCRKFLDWAKIEFAASRHHETLAWTLHFIWKPFGDVLARDFTPKLLQKAMQDAEINRVPHPNKKRKVKPLTRQGVNRIPLYARHCFGWGVVEGLVPETVHRALALVRGLKRGRCSFPESPKRLLVPDDVVKRTLEILPDMLRSMTELMLYTGMRPSEVLKLRSGDVKKHKSGAWVYEVRSHKGTHLGIVRSVPIGPRGMMALTRWLKPDQPDVYVFSPKERMRAQRETRIANRKSPRQPSQALDVRKHPDPDRNLGDRYNAGSFRQAIQGTIKRHNVKHPDTKIPVWCPSGLRKTHGQKVRDEKGREAARSVLGHAQGSTITERYADDLTLAIEVQRELG